MHSCTDPICTCCSVETLHWTRVDQALPDADITVLCWLEPMGQWFAGWWDGLEWRDAATGGTLDNVTHWSEPRGPGA